MYGAHFLPWSDWRLPILHPRSSLPITVRSCISKGGAARISKIAAKIAAILPNAKLKAEIDAERIRRSLGVDFGLQRTGIAVSLCGYAPSPIAVVNLKGEKLLEEVIRIAELERADEFIVGLPKSWDFQETEQCNKVREFAERLASQAAMKGSRVFLHDEYMTTENALEFMINRGSTKKSRRLDIDAYAAMMILQTYFDNHGRLAQLVVPKRFSLQRKLCSKYYSRLVLSEDEDDEDDDFNFVIQ